MKGRHRGVRSLPACSCLHASMHLRRRSLACVFRELDLVFKNQLAQKVHEKKELAALYWNSNSCLQAEKKMLENCARSLCTHVHLGAGAPSVWPQRNGVASVTSD